MADQELLWVWAYSRWALIVGLCSPQTPQITCTIYPPIAKSDLPSNRLYNLPPQITKSNLSSNHCTIYPPNRTWWFGVCTIWCLYNLDLKVNWTWWFEVKLDWVIWEGVVNHKLYRQFEGKSDLAILGMVNHTDNLRVNWTWWFEGKSEWMIWGLYNLVSVWFIPPQIGLGDLGSVLFSVCMIYPPRLGYLGSIWFGVCMIWCLFNFPPPTKSDLLIWCLYNLVSVWFTPPQSGLGNLVSVWFTPPKSDLVIWCLYDLVSVWFIPPKSDNQIIIFQYFF